MLRLRGGRRKRSAVNVFCIKEPVSVLRAVPSDEIVKVVRHAVSAKTERSGAIKVTQAEFWPVVFLELRKGLHRILLRSSAALHRNRRARSIGNGCGIE